MFSRFAFTVRPAKLIPQLCTITSKRNTSLEHFEPPYLESMKPKLPFYEAVTVQIRGYDYPPLEKFQKFAHIIAEYLCITVDCCWAQPTKHTSISRLRSKSTLVETTYKLSTYERNIKIVNVPAVKLPLLVELLQAGLPAGTTLNVFPFDELHDKDRYVPDHDLIAKRKELDELGGPINEEHENPFFQTPTK